MIVYGNGSAILHMDWESVNFVTGRATTRIGLLMATRTVTALESMMESAISGWGTVGGLASLMDQQTLLTQVRIETDALSLTSVVGIAGQVSGTMAAPSVACLESLSAVGKGPRFRGRRFWPSLVSSSQVGENGIITPTRLGQIRAGLDIFYGELEEDPDFVSLAIPQSTQEGERTPPVLPWPDVSTREVQARAATQRRRLRR